MLVSDWQEGESPTISSATDTGFVIESTDHCTGALSFPMKIVNDLKRLDIPKLF